MRVTVRPVVPTAARHENAAVHKVWQPHRSGARRFLPCRREVDHVTLPELTALCVYAATRCVGSVDPGTGLAVMEAILP